MKHRRLYVILVAALAMTVVLTSCAAPSTASSAASSLPTSGENSNISGLISQPEATSPPVTEEQFLKKAQEIGLTAEEAKSLANLGNPWEEILQMSYEEAQDILAEAKLLHEQFNLHELGLQLFEYFRRDSAINLILDKEAGITDEEISAFAIQRLLSENPVDFDFEKGVTKQEFDAVCEKHFGRVVGSYNNSKIKTLPSGNIVSTGWSPSPFDFVLKEYIEQPDGRYTASFYQIYMPMGEEPQKPYEIFETIITDIEEKRVDSYGEITLVKMEFEIVDPSSEHMYLRYYDVQGLGTATF